MTDDQRNSIIERFVAGQSFAYIADALTPEGEERELLGAIPDTIRDELRRLRAENDTLRGLLGNSSKDCVYCGLPAAEQAKCAHGFPGCPRGDDQMLSKHFADGYWLEQQEKELVRLRAENKQLGRISIALHRAVPAGCGADLYFESGETPHHVLTENCARCSHRYEGWQSALRTILAAGEVDE